MVTLDQGGRGRSALRLIPPPPDLCSTVEHFWVQDPPPDDAPAQRWRVVSDDAPHLVGKVTPRGCSLTLVGARTRHVDINVSGRCLTVGVRLQPGAIPALFGTPADLFTDRSFSLGEVLGVSPNEVCDPLAEADAVGTVQALVALLRSRRQIGSEVDPRVASLVAADAVGAQVREASRRHGLADRTLRDLSRQHLGMGLKRLWRIRRLHRAVQFGIARPSAGWARIAAETGYADQAHLIRDCRALLGETPTAFVARAV